MDSGDCFGHVFAQPNQYLPMLHLASVEPLSIIIGGVAIVVIAIIAYYVTRAMKGKVELELPKNGYNSGEEITGRVTLTAKKSLQLNRMYVALIGYEIVERRDSDGDRKTRRNEVYRNEVNILEAQSVPAGTNKEFDFTMNAPGGEATPSGDMAQKVAGAASAVAGALGALGMNTTTRRMDWKVEARADLPGVDIAKSKKVRVNLV
ncbi:MAG: arrestin family protein [Akkermansiaceae bacterium]|nr:arrestin family protein [Akkermansiaceae bacterium]